MEKGKSRTPQSPIPFTFDVICRVQSARLFSISGSDSELELELLELELELELLELELEL